jgi:thioredoxin 1
MIYGAVLGALFTLSQGTRQPLPSGGAPHIASQEELDNAIRAESPCLIDFYSERCPPCRRLIPVIDRLAAAYEERAAVYKINVGRSPQLARAFQIRSIPTVLLFKNGKEVKRIAGLQSPEFYRNALDRLIEHPEPTRQ